MCESSYVTHCAARADMPANKPTVVFRAHTTPRRSGSRTYATCYTTHRGSPPIFHSAVIVQPASRCKCTTVILSSCILQCSPGGAALSLSQSSRETCSMVNYSAAVMVIAYDLALTAINMQVQVKRSEFDADRPVRKTVPPAVTSQTKVFLCLC